MSKQSRRAGSASGDSRWAGSRFYLLGAVLLTLMLVAAACADDPELEDIDEIVEEPDEPEPDEPDEDTDEPADDGETVTLRAWYGREDFIPTDDFDSFTAEYPNIIVETDVIPLEQAPADFIRAHGAGEAPDIVQIEGFQRLPLIIGGFFRNMNEEFALFEQEEPEIWNSLMDIAFEAGGMDGDLYGLALHAQNAMWAYRPDLHEELGYDEPPATFEEAVQIAEEVLELEGDGFSPFCFVQSRSRGFRAEMAHHFMAMGGEFDEYNVPIFDSDAGHYFIEWFQMIRDEGLITAEAGGWGSGDMRAAFLAGNCMFSESTPNILPSWNEELEWGETFDWMPTPYREGHEDEFRQILASWGNYVNSDTEHPDEVALAFRYMAHPEQLKEVHLRYVPSASLEVLNDPELTEQQPWLLNEFSFASIPERIETSVAMPEHPRQLEMDEVLMDMWEEITSGRTESPEEVAQRYDALLDEFRQ